MNSSLEQMDQEIGVKIERALDSYQKRDYEQSFQLFQQLYQLKQHVLVSLAISTTMIKVVEFMLGVHYCEGFGLPMANRSKGLQLLRQFADDFGSTQQLNDPDAGGEALDTVESSSICGCDLLYAYKKYILTHLQQQQSPKEHADIEESVENTFNTEDQLLYCSFCDYLDKSDTERYRQNGEQC